MINIKNIKPEYKTSIYLEWAKTQDETVLNTNSRMWIKSHINDLRYIYDNNDVINSEMSLADFCNLSYIIQEFNWTMERNIILVL